MWLFALFNILEIFHAKKKLLSLLCELSCPSVCIIDRVWKGEWLLKGQQVGGLVTEEKQE